ncbi:hypothetical protein Pla175_39010 [Pirellulimonas nuda]|uniref:Uncharacterized protein n=1 Tax=Pirellulimonas nuda TaxID=2528009 RepID=A0A518DG97_9BACT|nr:hypothetical protein Pla175_39010 [Pirellulimonas nuda]
MRFRIWHLLTVMVFVALWVPISNWLLALEAMDHPTTPQTTLDYVGFYVGSIAIVGFPLVAVVGFFSRRLRARRTTDESE